MKLWLAIVLTACSSSPSPGTGIDAPGGTDGNTTHPDAPASVPAQITISGQALEQGQSSSMPVSGVAIAAFAVSDEQTPLATATTDAQGNYSLTIDTHNQPVDGYLRATKSGVVDTYVYPPAPMAADFAMATASLISTGNYSSLRSIEGASSGKGMIIMVVLDAGGTNPVQGATVSTTPTSDIVAYMDDNGQPFSNSATNTDGLAFIFDVPSGAVTVNASKSGMTFATHALKARADKLTTTLIQAQ